MSDRSIGNRRICSSESGYSCADTDRDEKGDEVSDQKSAKNDTKDAALEKKTDTKKENVKKEDTKSEKAVEQKETTAKKVGKR